MDQGRPRPSAARWLQPDPVPFWASRIFRWNLVLLAIMVSIAGIWMIFIEPGINAKAREEDAAAAAARKYVPRDPASTEPRPVRFDGVLDRAKDDVDPSERDEPYRYLVKYMAGVDPARLAEQSKFVDYETLMTRPEEVRGLTVRLNLMYWSSPQGRVRLDPPVGGVETVTRAYFSLPKAPKQVYIVDLVEPLPDLEKETDVALDAVFLRRVKFERELPDSHSEFHMAPLLVARNIAKVREPRPPVSYQFKWLVAIMGVGLFGFLSYFTLKAWSQTRSRGHGPRRIQG